MANLSIRRLDPAVYERLGLRAAKHGISMEEEVRRILSQAVLSPEKMSGVFNRFFGAEKGVDLEIPSQRDPHEPLNIQDCT